MRKVLAHATATVAATVTVTALSIVPAFAAGTVPDPKPNLPAGLQTKLNSLLGIFMAIVIIACVAGVFMAAWKLAIAYRHGEMGEAAGKLGGVAAACVLVGSASTIVTFLYA